jgi:hypothetical protein
MFIYEQALNLEIKTEKPPAHGQQGVSAIRPPLLSGGLSRATLFTAGYRAKLIEFCPHLFRDLLSLVDSLACISSRLII